MTTKLGFLAVSQYDDKYILKKHPRKELLEQTGYNNAHKTYVDTKQGKTKHVGYMLTCRGFNNLWFDIYSLNEWRTV